MKTIYAVQHLAFEDLGSLEDLFYELGFRVRYFEAGVDDLKPAFEHDGLTVILGGPIGVYEEADYPFLKQETALLKARLAANKPTIGICLGAQLIAKALGAKVYAGEHKEIGWSTLDIKATSENPLQGLIDQPVLHWHGDTFDLPTSATLLASSEHYPHQAFSCGTNVLALQFHLEVCGDNFERWLIGHTTELRQGNFSVQALRADTARYAQDLSHVARSILLDYLKQLNLV